jgi:hypothetical protein
VRNAFSVLLGLVAVFGLGLGLAFGGGVLYGRTTAAPAPTAATVAAAPSGSLGAFGGAGGAGALGGSGGAGAGQAGAAGRGNLLAGVIEKVEGNTLTIRTPQGTSTVNLAADTEIRQTVPAQTADLKPGQTVTVTGTTGADGSMQARTVTITPASAGGTPAPGANRPTATPTPGR